MSQLVELYVGKQATICNLSDSNLPNFLEGLTNSQKKKALALIKRLGDHGHPSNKEQCNPLGDGLYELKPGEMRFLFFYNDRHVVIVDGFLKPKPRRQRRKIIEAKAIMDSLKEITKNNKAKKGPR